MIDADYRQAAFDNGPNAHEFQREIGDERDDDRYRCISGRAGPGLDEQSDDRKKNILGDEP